MLGTVGLLAQRQRALQQSAGAARAALRAELELANGVEQVGEPDLLLEGLRLTGGEQRQRRCFQAAAARPDLRVFECA